VISFPTNLCSLPVFLVQFYEIGLEEDAASLKLQGKNALERKDYLAAIELYTEVCYPTFSPLIFPSEVYLSACTASYFSLPGFQFPIHLSVTATGYILGNPRHMFT
jgi:hypothetical protein